MSVADLGAEDAAQLDLRDHGAGERAGEPDGVADVVVVAVGERGSRRRAPARARDAGQDGLPVSKGST